MSDQGIKEKIKELENIDEIDELIVSVEEILDNVSNTPSVLDQLEAFKKNIENIKTTLDIISKNLEKQIARSKEYFLRRKNKYKDLSKQITYLEAEIDGLSYVLKDLLENKEAFFGSEEQEEIDFAISVIEGGKKKKEEKLSELKKEFSIVEEELHALTDEIADTMLTVLVLTPKKDLDKRLRSLGKLVLKELGKEGFERVVKLLLSKMGLALTIAI